MFSVDLLRPDLADRLVLIGLVTIVLAVALMLTALHRRRRRAREAAGG